MLNIPEQHRNGGSLRPMHGPCVYQEYQSTVFRYGASTPRQHRPGCPVKTKCGISVKPHQRPVMPSQNNLPPPIAPLENVCRLSGSLLSLPDSIKHSNGLHKNRIHKFESRLKTINAVDQLLLDFIHIDYLIGIFVENAYFTITTDS